MGWPSTARRAGLAASQASKRYSQRARNGQAVSGPVRMGGWPSITFSRVSATPVNHAPTNGVSNPGSPNTATGVVTGTVSATDVDGDSLTYTAPATTTKGVACRITVAEDSGVMVIASA